MNITQMFGITVASMGHFQGGNGYREKLSNGAAGGEYSKIVFDGEIPVGGIVVGTSEQAALLGLLRPLIREKKKFIGSLDDLGKGLHLKLASGTGV